MKLTIYNPNHRETKCVTCSKAMIQRDSLGALSRVYCAVLKQDLSKSVTECSVFDSIQNRVAMAEFMNLAAEMEVSPYDGKVTWTKDYKVIRKDGKWKQEIKKRRSVVARRRRDTTPLPPEPEKVN